MFRIAYALENGNPFAYILIYMLLMPPIATLIFAGVYKIMNYFKNKRKK